MKIITNQLFILIIFFTTQYTQAQYESPKQAKSKGGMVVTAHPLATAVGADILQRDGNAIDAMVAVHFALAVVYQRAGNIGGGGFLVYRAKNGDCHSLDFRETAPKAATQTMFLDSAGNAVASRSRDGHLAVGVPGSVAGMWEAHQLYGKLDWNGLLEPAIKLAEEGFLLTNGEAAVLNEHQTTFKEVNRFAPVFVKDSLFKKGDTIVQKELAQTLRLIQKYGRNGFYMGAVAELIEQEMAARGGLITRDDLAHYKAIWRKPLTFYYKQYQLITMPPPSAGGVLLAQLFGMVGRFPLVKWGFQSVRSVHLITEAERRAYADRSQHLGDPDFYKIPIQKLLDSNYIKRRLQNFDAQKATPSSQLKAGDMGKESEQTTHYSIVDKMGNAVAVTTTVNTDYGSKVVVKGGGFILNNEMDDFSAKPNSPNVFGLVGGEANAIAPNKRMLSSMTPTIVEKNNELFLVVGTPGGATITTSVFQVLLNVLEYKKPLLEAVHAKRFHHQYLPDKIYCEKGTFAPKTKQALKKMGHTVEERKSIGLVEAIMIHSDGTREGVADNRGIDSAQDTD